MTKRLRCLLCTNIPAPYRVALWRRLGDLVDLRVVCLDRSEPNRTWELGDVSDLDVRFVQGMRLTLPTTQIFLYVATGVGEIIRSIAPDVVVIGGWESPAYWQFLHASKTQGVPTVLFYSSTLNSHRFSRGPVSMVRRRFFRSVDAVIATGEASRDAAVAAGAHHSRIVTGFNTVDVDWYNDRAVQLRAEQNEHDIEYTYLYVGQLIRRKGLDNALRAFSSIRASDDHFAIVGAGRMEPDLRALVTELGLDGRVHFLGQLSADDLVAVYARSRTLVLPSTEEVWGLVVNEALASGLHAVVSTKAGIAPSIGHLESVFLADPTEAGIARGMVDSRAAWKGPTVRSWILAHGPEHLASQIVTAMRVACRPELS